MTSSENISKNSASTKIIFIELFHFENIYHLTDILDPKKRFYNNNNNL